MGVPLYDASVKLIDEQGRPTESLYDLLAAQGGNVSALTNTRLAVTGTYALLPKDAGKTIALGGSSFYTLTVNPASGYTPKFSCIILNEDTARAKRITIDGITSFLLWPGQSTILFNSNNTWRITTIPLWLNAAFTVYVNSSLGDDNNDGQVTGSGALKTIAAAQALILKYINNGGGAPKIKLDANLDYPVGSGLNFFYEQSTGAAQFSLTGDTGVSITCDAGGTCISVQDRCIVTVTNLTLKTSGSGSGGVFVRQLAVADLGSVNFDAFASGVHISVTTLGSCNITGNYSITGGAVAHMTVSDLGHMNYGNYTCTVSGGLTFTYFAIVSNFGIINNGGVNMTFAGPGSSTATTATTYSITNGGIINHSGTFPGNTAGTAPTSLAAYGVKS